MDYVYLDFGMFTAYQESQYGQVTRYLSDDGVELFIIPPIGNGGKVIDANPPRLDWML
jgi:hypothetical protein